MFKPLYNPKKLLLSLLIGSTLSSFAYAEKIVVAHRGASGYLPEHSMAAKSMAYAMDVDYIEQDVVMTKDNALVVLHDHYLDGVTNVADRYPGRQRKDGRYYAIDFTLAEIKTLEMTEAFKMKDGKAKAVYARRFPIWASDFKVHTLEEEIEMIQGLNISTGKNIGIYTEVKAPWFHRHEGKDISTAVLKVFKKYGYTEKEDLAYFQSFDAEELKRVKFELLPKFNMDVKLVQLIAETSWGETMQYIDGKPEAYNYDWMFKPGAMKIISKYADGVGPWHPMVVAPESTKDKLVFTSMVKDAHQAGMKVHPYTFRLDEGQIPAYAQDFDNLLDIFYNQANVDGVFTDFPDRAVDFLKRQNNH
ncbi:glycerophosphodiester phosphodiesterase [Psychromonas sp. Urea-02u-13]|uniref:glycerophosphodiester phosphodiesterase n=1 Tax=Psychromonas sp. Urea-02u-13 TaxID=2058326 RepID=UPI000C32BA5D|nr:glycerophosphodiester phosphodiesterase [Psychromonas sp. Urea-02u-13]PKG40476.1 glycerophosphodiester phosphodiesterase [Psychromonas sp. Urea-02u-13]